MATRPPPRATNSLELSALLRRERGDIGQDQDLERFEVGGVQQAVMHQFERDARLDQRLMPAQRGVFDVIAQLALRAQNHALCCE